MTKLEMFLPGAILVASGFLCGVLVSIVVVVGSHQRIPENPVQISKSVDGTCGPECETVAAAIREQTERLEYQNAVHENNRAERERQRRDDELFYFNNR